MTFDLWLWPFRWALNEHHHTKIDSNWVRICPVAERERERSSFRGTVYKWIEGFLRDRQRVRVGKEYSSYTSVLSGIPQGSFLGPILFTVFINDPPEFSKSCCYILADDTRIYNQCENHNVIQNYIHEFLN